MRDLRLGEEWKPFEVIALAASLGGFSALAQILAALPASFPVPILVLQHVSPSSSPSLLAELLSRHTSLIVVEAREGDELSPGCVYVAPPDLHLLVRLDGTVALSDSERVHFARPSADRLFESLAAAFQGRVVAVILTGNGCDGAEGIRAVHARGGRTLAQSPLTCKAPDMPSAAIDTGCVDMVLPLDQIAATLESLVKPPQPAHV